MVSCRPSVGAYAAGTLAVMGLTKIQRNKIYQAIAASIMDSTECDLKVGSSANDFSTITHVSDSFFMFKHDPSNGVYTVAAEVTDGGGFRKFSVIPLLDNLIPHIRAWADDVKLTVGVPDFWAEAKNGRTLISNLQQQDTGNTPFTQDEQKQISTLLHEIAHGLVGQFELTSEQIAHIEERLDEAAEASTRLGRKDWIIYTIGTITSLIITATVAAGIGEHILTLIIQSLAHLFADGSEPPQILT
jgi:hypothetical protein